MKVVLIGYRCTGKTAAGTRLAERLGLPFFDTDAMIEAREGRTIPEIVAEEGWEFFRAREKEIIGGFSGMRDCVLAPGGGAVMDRGNLAVLKERGIVIWLVADEATIVSRMNADSLNGKRRPALLGVDSPAETILLLAERAPVYRSAADFSIDTSGKDIEVVVDEICDCIRLRTTGA